MSLESTLKELLEHLYDSLTDKPGRSLIAPGVETVWDDCCNGQLSVRLTGSQLVYNKDRCAVAIDHTFEVEIVRCVATLDDQGQAPEGYEITQDALNILRDMRELGCALSSYEPTDRAVMRFNLNEYIPSNLEGGCGGGKWTVSVRTGLSWLA